MIAIDRPIYYPGNAVNFLSPQFLQIMPDAAEPVIECVNKDSRTVRENHHSRYPKSNELLAGFWILCNISCQRPNFRDVFRI